MSNNSIQPKCGEVRTAPRRPRINRSASSAIAAERKRPREVTRSSDAERQSPHLKVAASKSYSKLSPVGICPRPKVSGRNEPPQPNAKAISLRPFSSQPWAQEPQPSVGSKSLAFLPRPQRVFYALLVDDLICSRSARALRRRRGNTSNRSALTWLRRCARHGIQWPDNTPHGVHPRKYRPYAVASPERTPAASPTRGVSRDAAERALESCETLNFLAWSKLSIFGSPDRNYLNSMPSRLPMTSSHSSSPLLDLSRACRQPIYGQELYRPPNYLAIVPGIPAKPRPIAIASGSCMSQRNTRCTKPLRS
jgi:hypothetical protein